MNTTGSNQLSRVCVEEVLGSTFFRINRLTLFLLSLCLSHRERERSCCCSCNYKNDSSDAIADFIRRAWLRKKKKKKTYCREGRRRRRETKQGFCQQRLWRPQLLSSASGSFSPLLLMNNVWPKHLATLFTHCSWYPTRKLKQTQ